MDNRFLGELSTDVYGLTVNEMRLAHFGTTAAEGAAAAQTAYMPLSPARLQLRL